ncbi:MAG: glutamate formiminotransferase/formiminotetrahydrofolate cyclodeaminase [Chitinophagales bacterium]|jgi:glutamate formiminotransferase/formiminotetrahydrofolate cyclodeaminase
MRKLIECVPNISEGRDDAKIKAIYSVVETVEGVKLLDVDPGRATNRTVITFVGEPDGVVEAAFRLIKKAQELIDMTKHKGEHPRFGATDVCPFVPVANASMEDCIACAQALGERVGKDLGIPVYLYENAATSPQRKNLATVRSGEYEGIAEKIVKSEWKPDFGPASFQAKSGNIAISARDFLIAYNVNLNTTSVRRANNIAFDIREQGRSKTVDGSPTGKKVMDANGNPVRIPGSCKGVKGIGWFIEEYGVAQISMNITNVNDTPLHKAFDECVKSAYNRGMRVTGSELVGLVPLKSMLDAGKYFLIKQERSIGVSEDELIKIAVKSMGLDELTTFDPKKNIIEYMLGEDDVRPLIKMDLRAFANETASESPAPGGGSIAAYLGALGVSLGTMVANLSSHKRGWDDRWEEFSDWAKKGQELKDKLLWLVDEDTNSFNKIMDAFKLPKSNEEEKAARSQAIQDATKYAIEIPFQVMETSYASFELLKEMAVNGNPNSVSDAGVGALSVRSAVLGAYLNVKINLADLKDENYKNEMLAKASKLAADTKVAEEEILAIVETKL